MLRSKFRPKPNLQHEVIIFQNSKTYFTLTYFGNSKMLKLLKMDNFDKLYDTIVVSTITWIGLFIKSEFTMFYKYENGNKYRVVMLDDHSLAVIARQRIRN